MRTSNKWLIWLAIIMVVSLIISGFFFVRSELIDYKTGDVNQERIDELVTFNEEINDIFGFCLSSDDTCK